MGSGREEPISGILWNSSHSMSRALVMMHANHNGQCYWIFIFLLESAASHIQNQFNSTSLHCQVVWNNEQL